MHSGVGICMPILLNDKSMHSGIGKLSKAVDKPRFVPTDIRRSSSEVSALEYYIVLVLMESFSSVYCT